VLYQLDHGGRLPKEQRDFGNQRTSSVRSPSRLVLTFVLQWHQGIPIEVAPFAYVAVLHRLAQLGSPTTAEKSTAVGAHGQVLTLRMGKAKAGPVVSDNGNFIIDAPFPKEMMERPTEVSRPFPIRKRID
jgi:ribose 5-phosphate isomerase